MFVQKHMLHFQVLNDLFLENWSKINVIKWQVSKYKLIPNDDTKSDGRTERTGSTGARGEGGVGGEGVGAVKYQHWGGINPIKAQNCPELFFSPQQ